jgi:hypothetical protein
MANISEQLLDDLFKALIREYLTSRKKADLSKAVTELQDVITEVALNQRMSEDEKNSKLIDAGRDAVNRVRK